MWAILNFIQNNPNIAGICRIPINLELVCSTWEQQPFSESSLSMSQLYDKVLISLGIRYLDKKNSGLTKENQFDIGNIDRLQVLRACSQHFGFLEYLGYQSILQDKLFLKIDLAREYLSNRFSSNASGLPSDDVLKQQKFFGLIKPISNHERYEGLCDYYFNHLTFRDFFAARYLAKCLQKSKNSNLLLDYFPHNWEHPDNLSIEQFIIKHKFNPNYEIIWWFTAGTLANNKDYETLRKFFMLLLGEPHDLLGIQAACIMLRCLDEIQDYSALDEKSLLIDYIKEWLELAISSENKETYFSFIERLKISRWLLGQPYICSLFITQFEKAYNQNKANNYINMLIQINYLPEELLKTIVSNLSYKEMYKCYSCVSTSNNSNFVIKIHSGNIFSKIKGLTNSKNNLLKILNKENSSTITQFRIGLMCGDNRLKKSTSFFTISVSEMWMENKNSNNPIDTATCSSGFLMNLVDSHEDINLRIQALYALLALAQTSDSLKSGIEDILKFIIILANESENIHLRIEAIRAIGFLFSDIHIYYACASKSIPNIIKVLGDIVVKCEEFNSKIAALNAFGYLVKSLTFYERKSQSVKKIKQILTLLKKINITDIELPPP